MWVFALDFEFAPNDMNASWLKLLFFRTSDAGFGSPHQTWCCPRWAQNTPPTFSSTRAPLSS